MEWRKRLSANQILKFTNEYNKDIVNQMKLNWQNLSQRVAFSECNQKGAQH